MAAAGFFTTEVWTAGGLTTHYVRVSQCVMGSIFDATCWQLAFRCSLKDDLQCEVKWDDCLMEALLLPFSVCFGYLTGDYPGE